MDSKQPKYKTGDIVKNRAEYLNWYRLVLGVVGKEDYLYIDWTPDNGWHYNPNRSVVSIKQFEITHPYLVDSFSGDKLNRFIMIVQKAMAEHSKIFSYLDESLNESNDFYFKKYEK